MRLLQRGVLANPGPKVTPGVLAVLGAPGKADITRPLDAQGETSGQTARLAGSPATTIRRMFAAGEPTRERQSLSARLTLRVLRAYDVRFSGRTEHSEETGCYLRAGEASTPRCNKAH